MTERMQKRNLRVAGHCYRSRRLELFDAGFQQCYAFVEGSVSRVHLTPRHTLCQLRFQLGNVRSLTLQSLQNTAECSLKHVCADEARRRPGRHRAVNREQRS
jgi:hypothetical protein